MRARESGVALVEFALVLPLLLLILIGMLDFGKIFNYWIDETHLANEGARYAVVNKNPSLGGGSLQSYIQQQADTPELRNGGTSAVPVGTQVCISFPNGTATVGDPVEVTVTTDYHFVPFIGAKTGAPYWVDFEIAHVASCPGHRARIEEARQLVAERFGVTEADRHTAAGSDEHHGRPAVADQVAAGEQVVFGRLHFTRGANRAPSPAAVSSPIQGVTPRRSARPRTLMAVRPTTPRSAARRRRTSTC